MLHGSFPSGIQFQRCPVCFEPTDYLGNDEPDEYWEQNIARHREYVAVDEAAAPSIPVLEGARVQLDGEQFYISTWDVVNGGIRHRLRPTDLVQVGKQVFEILHYSYDQRRYLVEPFSTKLTDADLAALSTRRPAGEDDECTCTSCSPG